LAKNKTKQNKKTQMQVEYIISEKPGTRSVSDFEIFIYI
jgi:hypothetical protein